MKDFTTDVTWLRILGTVLVLIGVALVGLALWDGDSPVKAFVAGGSVCTIGAIWLTVARRKSREGSPTTPTSGPPDSVATAPRSPRKG